MNAAKPFCFIVWRWSPARTMTSTPTSDALASSWRTMVVPPLLSIVGAGTATGCERRRRRGDERGQQGGGEFQDVDSFESRTSVTVTAFFK